MAEILLVEDSPKIRQFKKEAIKKAGFNVTSAYNGIEACHILDTEAYQPDAIVSDLNQPEFEGYDLTHLLRGQFKWRIFQQIPELKRRFEKRVEIALRYKHLRDKFGKTPLILTSSGPVPEWPWKKVKGEWAVWESANAEILHYSRVLELADKFFVIEPVHSGDNLDVTGIIGMDALIQYLKEKLLSITSSDNARSSAK